MKNVTKKLFCLLLSVLMVLSFAACGKKDDGKTTQAPTEKKTEAPTEKKTEAPTEKQTEAPTQGETKATEAPTDAPTEAPTQSEDQDNPLAWEKYDEVVTVKMAHMLQAGVVYPEGDSQENNAWTRYALEKFNIKMVDAWASEGDYYDKIQLAMMNPDDPDAGLPDIFTCTASQLSQMVEYGLVADLTEAFDKYASNTLKEIENRDVDCFETGIMNGKLYGISTQHYGYINNVVQIWVRQDWLDNLGLAQPKTWEDLYNVCKAFTENDPDKNGLNDTVGFCLYKDFVYFNSLFNSYNAYPNLWIEKNGEIVWGGIQPEVKECLTYFQKMYKDGYINQEFATLNKSGMKGYIESGKAGVCLYTGSFGYSIGMNSYINNNNAMFYCMEIPSIDGNPVIHGFGMGGGTYNCVNANFKNPEALIKLSNIYVWVFNDLEDKDVKSTFSYYNGNPGPIGVNSPYEGNKAAMVADVQDSRNPEKLDASIIASYYEPLLKWLDEKDPAGLPCYYQVSKDGALKKVAHVIENHEYILNKYHNVPGEEYTKYMGTLNAMQDETYTKIIMGESMDIFDTFVETWKKSGGDAVTAEMNGK